MFHSVCLHHSVIVSYFSSKANNNHVNTRVCDRFSFIPYITGCHLSHILAISHAWFPTSQSTCICGPLLPKYHGSVFLWNLSIVSYETGVAVAMVLIFTMLRCSATFCRKRVLPLACPLLLSPTANADVADPVLLFYFSFIDRWWWAAGWVGLCKGGDVTVGWGFTGCRVRRYSRWAL